MNVPLRQIRALHTEETVTVYQAYDAAIAEPAVAPGASCRRSSGTG